MNQSNSPTIRQLAKIAGVSRTTVSWALRDDPRIKPETRSRIQKIAQEQGYHVDALTSQLMARFRTARKHRSLTKLAYLTEFSNENEWKKVYNNFKYFQGARKRANELGYDIDPIWSTQPGMNSNRLTNILDTRAIRGVLISPAEDTGANIKILPEHFSIVAFSHTYKNSSINRVSHDAYGAMHLTVQQVIKTGHQRIAYINDREQDDRSNSEWLSSFLHCRFKATRGLLLEPLLQKQWNEEKILAWVEKKKPDAIISNTYVPLNVLCKAGDVCCKRIAFYSLDLQGKDSGHGGIDQCPEQIGRAGAELLIGMLRNNNYGEQEFPKDVRIRGVWREATNL